MQTRNRLAILFFGCVFLLLHVGCKTPSPGAYEPRRGDEIVVAGQFVHTGTPVVLWMDSGGYDAYRVERRFSPIEKADWEHSTAEVRDLRSPNRYNLRRSGLSDDEIERVRGGGWDLPLLQKVVDQFVIHFDVAGASPEWFQGVPRYRRLSGRLIVGLARAPLPTLVRQQRGGDPATVHTRSVRHES